MNERVYLKGPVESLDPYGPDGYQVTEFVDKEPTRQISVFGEQWISSLDEYHPLAGMTLGDQPLPPDWRPEDEDDDVEFLSQEEFEEYWAEAMRRRGSTE